MTARLPAGVVRSVVLGGGLVGCVVVVVAAVELAASAGGGGGAGGGGNAAGPWSWFAGAIVLAIAVPRIRPPLERLADRAAYGRQGDPHALLAGFVSRISDTLAMDDVLPHLARAAAQATHSPSGGVRLWLADGGERHETWPPDARAGIGEGEVSLLLEHGGSAVGRLEVAGADRELRDADRELLNRLAGPAGLALANVRLTLELRQRLAQTMALAESIRQSRQRMLETRREQRERFVSAVRQRVLSRLDAVEAHLAQAAEGVAGSLEAAELETRACLDALRELAAGVFPPALTERGLGPALELHALRSQGVISVRDGSPGTATGYRKDGEDGEDGEDILTIPDARVAGRRYPPLLEAAAYFCCAALIDDAASGERLDIELTGDAEHLRFTVRSASPISPAVHQLMCDRVEALGGQLAAGSEGGEVVVRGELPTAGTSVSTLVERLGETASAGPVQRGTP